MTFEAMNDLMQNPAFMARIRACCLSLYGDKVAEGGASAALATDILRGGGDGVMTFVRLLSTDEGIINAAKATDPESGLQLDQSLVTDDQIKGTVLHQWPVVAGLWHTAT